MNDNTRNPYGATKQQSPQRYTPPLSEKHIASRLWSWGDFFRIVGAWLGILVIGIFGTLFIVAAQNVSDPTIFSHPDEILTSQNISNALLIVEFLALFGSVFFFGVLRKQISWQEIGFRPLNVQQILWSVGLTILFLGVSGLFEYGIFALHLPIGNQLANLYAMGPISHATVSGDVLQVFLTVLAIPCAEQIFFFGFLFRFSFERWGIWSASITYIVLNMIASALGLDIASALVMLLLSIATVIAFVKTRSIWSTIILLCSAMLVASLLPLFPLH
jgi:membrane protease YdiL (CAAX protease family)